MAFNIGGIGGNTSSLMNNILGGLANGGGLPTKGTFNVASLASMLASINGIGKKQSMKNYFYKYKIQTFQLLIPNEEPINILTDAVQKVIITRLYDEAIHPIMEVVTLLPPRLHQKMKENKQELKVRLRIQKCSNTRSGEPLSNKDYINGTFDLIIDDETDFKEEEEYAKVNKTSTGHDGKYVFNISDYTTEYTLSLWDRKKIEAMLNVVNSIVENATVSNALKKIYSESGIDKILISPLDNDKNYSEIRIKPMNLMNLPAYIEKIYGTYYSGSCVFCDYRCLYFLSKNGICDAKEDGEYTRTIFKIPKTTDSRKHSKGTTQDTTNKFYYLYLDNDSIDFGSPSNSKDVTDGNNFTIVDPNKNETTAVEGAGNQGGKGNSRVVEDNYSNEFNKSTMISDVIEQSSVATITAVDYDEDAFTPNKEFVIIFDDKKMKSKNGFYRITESQSILTKSKAGLDIIGKHKLVFKSAISSGNDDSNVGKASEVKTMSEESKKDTSNVGANATGKEFTPEGPKPKTTTNTQNNVVNTSGVPSYMTNYNTAMENRNQNYQYDSLGNLQGVEIKNKDNVITKDDSLDVRAAKIQAQQKQLPSEGPKSKIA